MQASAVPGDQNQVLVKISARKIVVTNGSRLPGHELHWSMQQDVCCASVLWLQAYDACEPNARAVCWQEMGENGMLIRSSLHAVGVFARALGPEFSGALLRAVLLPLLERLGDSSASVSEAAEEALASVCLHCGYEGLQELVGRNIDYVVDGVCAQFRHMEHHPRYETRALFLGMPCGRAGQG